MTHDLDGIKARLRNKALTMISDEMADIAADMREFVLGVAVGTIALICILNWL